MQPAFLIEILALEAQRGSRGGIRIFIRRCVWCWGWGCWWWRGGEGLIAHQAGQSCSLLNEVQTGHGAWDFLGFAQFQVFIEFMRQVLFVGVLFIFLRQLICVNI